MRLINSTSGPAGFNLLASSKGISDRIMRHFLLRFLPLALSSLVFAAVAPAQKLIAHVSTPDLHDRSRNSDQPWSGDWYQSSGGFRRHERYRSSSTSDTAIGYAHGDPDSVPSVYMDYDKALALGKEMLEQRSLPSLTPSLGDVARALRQSSNHPAPDGKTSSTIRIPPNL
jgi:hypothetical protein